MKQQLAICILYLLKCIVYMLMVYFAECYAMATRQWYILQLDTKRQHSIATKHVEARIDYL